MTVLVGWIESALDVLWVGWMVYWAGQPLFDYARGRAKEVTRKGRGNLQSYILLIAGFAVLQISFTGPLTFLGVGFLPNTLPVVTVGLVLAVAGLAFSVWARVYLGSNWSPSAMLKKGQDLVTTGPYAIVRNPIYLGLTVAMIGTGIVFGGYRVIISIACVALFSWLRTREEEKLMSEQFGERYAEYKERVSAFIPRVI